MHHGRTDGRGRRGRNNPNHLEWFIRRLHAIDALGRNHERARAPALLSSRTLSIPRNEDTTVGLRHAIPKGEQPRPDFFRKLDDWAVMRSHRCRK